MEKRGRLEDKNKEMERRNCGEKERGEEIGRKGEDKGEIISKQRKEEIHKKNPEKYRKIDR